MKGGSQAGRVNNDYRFKKLKSLADYSRKQRSNKPSSKQKDSKTNWWLYIIKAKEADAAKPFVWAQRKGYVNTLSVRFADEKLANALEATLSKFDKIDDGHQATKFEGNNLYIVIAELKDRGPNIVAWAWNKRKIFIQHSIHYVSPFMARFLDHLLYSLEELTLGKHYFDPQSEGDEEDFYELMGI